jgi:hypothetical protein
VRIRAILAAAALAVGLIASPAGAAVRVPQGFGGMMVDGPIFDEQVDLAQQLDRMVASGVESLRFTVDWSSIQPYRNIGDVPADERSSFTNVSGVPTRFATIDRLVGLAATRRLSMLPMVLFTPEWDAQHPGELGSPPKPMAPFGNFLTALIGRYGPRGSFWTQHPEIPRDPIGMWQIWNEPNFLDNWSVQPNFVPSYLRLLRTAHNAIKTADPGAKVVLAGLPNDVWRYVAEIYKVRGARRLFDVVAVHPYTAQPAGVITILQRVRDVMNRAGDTRKPLLASELGWPSAAGKTSIKFGFETTEARQAQRLARVLPLLARNRNRLHLMGFYYYTWMTTYTGQLPFNYAGLLRVGSDRIFMKPAFSSFTTGTLALERCKRKGATATICLRRSG